MRKILAVMAIAVVIFTIGVTLLQAKYPPELCHKLCSADYTPGSYYYEICYNDCLHGIV